MFLFTGGISCWRGFQMELSENSNGLAEFDFTLITAFKVLVRKSTKAMIAAINSVQPSALFIGMTAPKQEKWAHEHFAALQVGHVCCIGAVFDFYAGEVSRAPQVFIILGLEWLYRLLSEPRRMWRRYLIGNVKFVWHVAGEWLANGKIKV